MSAADDLDSGWDDVPESASVPPLPTQAPVSAVVNKLAAPPPVPSLPPVTIAPRPRPSRRVSAVAALRWGSLAPSVAPPDEAAVRAPSVSDEPTLEIGATEEYWEPDGDAGPSAEPPTEASRDAATEDVRDDELFVEGQSFEEESAQDVNVRDVSSEAETGFPDFRARRLGSGTIAALVLAAGALVVAIAVPSRPTSSAERSAASRAANVPARPVSEPRNPDPIPLPVASADDEATRSAVPPSHRAPVAELGPSNAKLDSVRSAVTLRPKRAPKHRVAPRRESEAPDTEAANAAPSAAVELAPLAEPAAESTTPATPSPDVPSAQGLVDTRAPAGEASQ
ncbi:MAG TPA: hypothetical protein VFZ53_07310 [Polyangiaceae bacterium]